MKEDKQALIEFAESVLANYEIGSYMAGTKSEALMRIALAALTAQPVKLPTAFTTAYASPGCDERFMRKSEVIAAIRAAGYEVQE